ncbi:MAG: hypothetical protein WCU00_06015 [Candidatus Latescibacterota bacterium]
MLRIESALKIISSVLFVVMLSGCSKSTTGPEEKVSISVATEKYSTISGIKYCKIQYLITDGKENPLSSKRVDFAITEGDATLSINTGTTTNSGAIEILITKITLSTANIKATVYGYDASITTSIAFIDSKVLEPPSSR